MRAKKPATARLEGKYTVDAKTGCWHWLGGTNGNRYGRCRDSNGWLRPVHRITYELICGPITEGLQIHHVCGNRDCINPVHMKAVTASEHANAHPR